MAFVVAVPDHGSPLSGEAAEFVPSWKEPEPQRIADASWCLISLGAYSDDSNDSDDAEENLPVLPAVAAAPPIDSQFRRPWRVSAPEFVPRGGLATKNAVLDSPMSRASTDYKDSDSNVSDEMTPSKSDDATHDVVPRPWHRSRRSTGKYDDSSTGCRSTSPSSLIDDCSPDSTAASCTSRSRSSTPPLAREQEEAEPIGIPMLLLWRTLASEPPEESMPFAAEPKQATAVPRSSGSWRREVSPTKKLDISDDSWVARQLARRNSRSPSEDDTEAPNDEDIFRTVKSLLNKLTVDKFESLAAQILQCGITHVRHLEFLIQQVFEKATTQHHFIDMYADLCDLLNIYFSEHPIADDPKKTFKKVLLRCCQASFEKHLTPPQELASLSNEERQIAGHAYKMRMLGNIKFVGALFVRKLPASKLVLAIMEELLDPPTSESLESLAALLTAIGPTFDTPDWPYRLTLNAVFTQVEKLSKTASTNGRIRCLLKDVLDLRNSGWQDRKPKKIEAPLKLEEVAAKAAMETASSWQRESCGRKDWDSVGKERLGKLCNIVSNKRVQFNNAICQQQDGPLAES